MHSVKLVAANLVAALLVAIASVACTVKQTADKMDQSVDLVWPSKENKPQEKAQ